MHDAIGNVGKREREEEERKLLVLERKQSSFIQQIVSASSNDLCNSGSPGMIRSKNKEIGSLKTLHKQREREKVKVQKGDYLFPCITLLDDAFNRDQTALI